MDSLWFAAYLILTGLAILQSVLVAIQTWEHRRYARSCTSTQACHRSQGRAAVFAPCKGIDVGLEENLRALLRQDHDDYEVNFVVESAEDPAVAVIRRVMDEHPWVATRLVIAGRATHTGQKIHNLRAATAWISPQIEYLAFVDSDAGPRPEWLRILTSQLAQPDMGAVTGYRWFVPMRPSLANHLLYSINCEVMSLLGHSSHHLIWGGSWGIRREVFERIGLYEAWEGTLSDDLMAGRQLRAAGLHVRFEPACVVASPLNYSPRQMLSFLRRQYLLGRFYVFHWWVLAFASAATMNLAWLANLVALAGGLVFGNPPAWIPVSACAVLYLLSVQRRWVRQDLIRTYLPERRHALRKARRFDIWAGPLAGLINWVGLWGSLFGRHVTWRGVLYRVLAGGQVRLVSREDGPASMSPDEPESSPTADVLVRRPVSFRKAG